MSLYADVLKLIRRQGLLEGARAVVVGLSGGPDSVCLLDLLALMVERGDVETSLRAAHLNHGLRGLESDADAAFAREFARKRAVPLTVERRDIKAIRASDGGSVEAVARRERYAFLSSVAGEVGAEVVAAGHNADDQIETVLHRLIRGAGLRGLRGMALTRRLEDGSAVRLVRPLLRTRRAEILAHLRERGISFREDSSNRDTAFLRNRIRHALLPLLESEYNPAFGESVVRLSRAVSGAYDLLLGLAQAKAGGCVAGAAFDIEPFRRAHDALKPLLIDAALEGAGAGAPQLAAAHYQAIVDLALDGEPGSRIDLPGGMVASRSGGAVEFSSARRPEPARPVACPVVVPGDTRVPGSGRSLKADVLERSQLDLDAFLATKTRYDEVVDYDALAGPLVLRARRSGDAFCPFGMHGRKKVGDFLTDLKVPAAERDGVLILAAGEQPVWVVGYRIDDRVRVTPRTRRVLKLSVEQREEA